MNERIRELAEQAGAHFGEGLEFAVVFGELSDFEKFAELILQECVSQCEKVADQADKMAKSKFVTPEGRLLNEGIWGGATNCSALIKNHFGVE